MIRVQTQRAADLDAMMSVMTSQDGRRYSAAWIDGLARGRSLGQGVVVSGDHATRDDVRQLDETTPMRFRTARQLSIPGAFAAPVARRCVRVMNEIIYRRAPTAPRETLQSLQAFFHTHDRVDLFSLFAPRGFLEYQFVVPFDRPDVVKLVIERIVRDRIEPFFAVLKRFGKRNPGALSFPLPGWMAAFDFPFSSALSNLFHDLDSLIAGAGGRVFLAKDACLRPDVLPTMYPDLASWRDIRAPYDPDHVMQSDLAARLSLL